MKLSDVQAGRIGEYVLKGRAPLLQIISALPPSTKPLPGARLLIRKR